MPCFREVNQTVLYLKVSMQLLSGKPYKFVKEADSVNELEVGLLRICGKVKPRGSGIRAPACHVKYWPFGELKGGKRFVRLALRSGVPFLC